MRFGKSRAQAVFRQLVRQHAEPYDLTRSTDEANGRFGEHDESETTVTGVDLYLFNPGESAIETEYGERLSGDLEGLSLVGADIREGDEVTYDGTVYEVSGKPEIVKDGVLKSFVLEKKVNAG